MRYYLLKYTDTVPSGFGGVSNGPCIRILPKYRADRGLLEHEKFHVRQWWGGFALALLIALSASLCGLVVVAALFLGCSLGLHPVLYRLIRPYRQWSEVRAYRIQLGQYGPSANADFAVRALVEKYSLGLTHDEARRLLRLM